MAVLIYMIYKPVTHPRRHHQATHWVGKWVTNALSSWKAHNFQVWNSCLCRVMSGQWDLPSSPSNELTSENEAARRFSNSSNGRNPKWTIINGVSTCQQDTKLRRCGDSEPALFFENKLLYLVNQPFPGSDLQCVCVGWGCGEITFLPGNESACSEIEK